MKSAGEVYLLWQWLTITRKRYGQIGSQLGTSTQFSSGSHDMERRMRSLDDSLGPVTLQQRMNIMKDLEKVWAVWKSLRDE